ncbi:helix-turn-helix domain-containing protein [Streptomyces hoynatensis]|uniref:XRE family transcriptional regulator n=1 Tax=Streptomyces hoynatensis TaxID=1141874 RepID=A0A3A9YTV2_9ACTN|nr:helix-turn-helix transcriptional regulator [Streptomyces hoynatensis]RKN39502.1 XRE family transcriptional regulator [Streptomyces hoynatensis]
MELANESHTTPEVRLGRHIRALRTQRGLSLRGLSEKVTGYSYSYLGRVELGKQRASDALVEALDDYFGTGGVLADIHGLSHDFHVATYSRDFIRREKDAIRIQVFTSSLIPGLLQTSGYAHAAFLAGMPRIPAQGVGALVATRIDRQGIFEREDPPYYWAIMDEAALRRPTTDKQVMSDQLAHTLRIAERPYVTVQVVPFAAGLHTMLGGSLTLLTMKDGGTVGLVESFDGADTVEEPRRLADLAQRFDLVQSHALSEKESLGLIRECLKEYGSDIDF